MRPHAIPTTPLVHSTIAANKKTVRNVIPAYRINKYIKPTYCFSYLKRFWQGYGNNMICWSRTQEFAIIPYVGPILVSNRLINTDTSIISRINLPFVSYMYLHLSHSVWPSSPTIFILDRPPVNIWFVQLVELRYVLYYCTFLGKKYIYI